MWSPITCKGNNYNYYNILLSLCFRKQPMQHQPLSETSSINSLSGEKVDLGDQQNSEQTEIQLKV